MGFFKGKAVFKRGASKLPLQFPVTNKGEGRYPPLIEAAPQNVSAEQYVELYTESEKNHQLFCDVNEVIVWQAA
ncbi:hypothetical protein [Peribacillus sp. Bi134]|uniref:hypothetical protein n=1 Tax=Peribacillus sp. Bi134 TaxID=2884272 RepID=UPI001D7B60EC|nr:hypothetical protein [Peribacillus sp. Bi134]CAH0233091.1 hypothetical protein SRABI134_02764 [Peribacillus sp. Bi134]